MQARRNLDVEFCGKLPLNQTSLIQPHGVMLLVAKAGLRILQVSENITELIGIEAENVVNQSLDKYLDKVSLENFVGQAGDPGEKLIMNLTFTQAENRTSSLAIVHQTTDNYLVEIELERFVRNNQNSFISVFHDVKQVTSQINAATTIADVCHIAAKKIKQVSGFDKVMIYTFDEDWNGSVVAEEMEQGMESYLGLKFPASDIPRSAREMYFKNPYRLIPNREYEPVRLYPLLNPTTHSFTDLSAAELRSVAPVHLEYLKNMKVTASMSTRIIRDQKLWGLIACHHRTPKYLSLEERSIFEWLSDVISSKISALYTTESVAKTSVLHEQFVQLVEDIYRCESLTEVWESKQQELQEYLRADGIAFFWNGTIERVGKAPEREDLEVLHYWIRGKPANKIFSDAALPLVFDEAAGYASIASGLLSLPIQAEQGNYLLAFRQEAIRKLAWSGNPNEAIRFEENSTAYHPRNSFRQWQETVRNTATPWSEEELSAAEHLRNVLVEFTLAKLYG